MVLSVTGMNWLAGSFVSVRPTAGDAGVQFVNFSCGVCCARDNTSVYDPSADEV
jgi:hypothetical protein